VANHPRGRRPDLIHERPKEEWHQLLDELTRVRAGDDVTIELLDAEFGDEFEAERMPLLPAFGRILLTVPVPVAAPAG
jgi:hypothetical protein